LLVAVTLGLLVIGLVLQVYLSGVRGHRQAAALARLTLDAQAALDMLVRDLQMAGHVQATGVQVGGAALPRALARPYAFPRALWGCEAGFADLRAPLAQAQCDIRPGEPALEINLQATPETAPLTVTAGAARPEPTDCIGQAIPGTQVAGLAGVLFLVSHRYFLGPPTDPGGSRSLMCVGQGGIPQPLVEGVQALQLRYGIDPDSVRGIPGPRRAQRYVGAADVADWTQVVSVRLCLLMRSADPVHGLGEAPPFIDCAGARQAAPADRHLYRAFHATATLRNPGL
jgi:type IV pilus assembly protein PilW